MVVSNFFAQLINKNLKKYSSGLKKNFKDSYFWYH